MKQRLYLIAGAILALVLSAGAGYGYSAWNASGEISGLEAAIDGYEKQIQIVAETRTAHERRYDVRTAQLKLREAQLELHDQNYGTAASHIQQASAALSAAKKGAEDTKRAALDAASDELVAVLSTAKAEDASAAADIDDVVAALDRYLSAN